MERFLKQQMEPLYLSRRRAPDEWKPPWSAGFLNQTCQLGCPVIPPVNETIASPIVSYFESGLWWQYWPETTEADNSCILHHNVADFAGIDFFGRHVFLREPSPKTYPDERMPAMIHWWKLILSHEVIFNFSTREMQILMFDYVCCAKEWTDSDLSAFRHFRKTQESFGTLV